MIRILAFAALISISGCAWNSVLTPYAPHGDTSDPNSAATVWGAADDTSMYFRKLNGKGLPSRKFAGYPHSLSLLPGTYEIEVYFINADLRDAIFPVTITVEAGHTYILEHSVTGDYMRGRVGVNLKDLGTNIHCSHERYKTVRGSAKLNCQ